MTFVPENPNNLIHVDYYTDLAECSSAFDEFAHTYAKLRALNSNDIVTLKEPDELAQYLVDLTNFYIRSELDG